MWKLYAVCMLFVFLLSWALSSWAETMVGQIKQQDSVEWVWEK